MTIVAIVLAFGYVVSTALFLYFLKKILDAASRERWELRERNREPKIRTAPPVLSEYEKDQVRSIPTEPAKPIDEFDLVGQMNPDTPLRTEDAAE